jgi:hypothetical protein
MRPIIGTYEWTEQYDGKMNLLEKLSMVGMLARTQVEDIWERSFLGQRSLEAKRARVNFDEVVLPDTRLVKEAVEYVENAYPTSMLKHCYRTYYWGSLLAQYENLELDAELFLLANLFHDLGLTDNFIGDAKTSCFTRQSGRIAENFVREHGWDSGKARRIYQAISLHLNPFIDPLVYGAEEALVGAAATLDLLGLHHQRIAPEMIRFVNTRYDRTDLNRDFSKRMEHQHHHSDTRACFYAKLGATQFLSQNPLNRSELQ